MKALFILFSVAVLILETSGCRAKSPQTPTAAQVIQKLQTGILVQQNEIKRRETLRVLEMNIVKDIASAANDSVTGKVKNPNLGHLLSGGITVKPATIKPLTVNHITIATTAPILEENWHFVIPADATADEMSQIKALEDIYESNRQPLERAKASLGGIEPLFYDLLELAKTDTDAKQLVLKYNIE